MPTALCLGEVLIDFVADVPDVSLAECPGFRKAAGGAPANVAAGLARLGVETAYLTKVGDDPFGHFFRNTLAGVGVETRFIRFDPKVHTGLAFVALQSDGERDFTFYRDPAADMLYRPDEVPDEAFEGCRVYHFGSISTITEPSRSATLDGVRRARERGAFVSYDPNYRPPLWPDADAARKEIRASIPLADVVKVSEEEAELLFGPADAPTQAQRILAEGPVLAAITMGPGGSYLATRKVSAEIPPFRVDAVDATGAGDGFVAGLLCGLLGQYGPVVTELPALERIGRFANAVGALVCTRKGAIPSMPAADEVRELAGE